MSDDHYDCAACHATGIYYQQIATCNNCWQYICYDCTLVKSEDSHYIGEDIRDEEENLDSKYCPFCSGEKISNRQKVEFLLHILKMDEGYLDKLILKDRKNKK